MIGHLLCQYCTRLNKDHISIPGLKSNLDITVPVPIITLHKNINLQYWGKLFLSELNLEILACIS